MSSSTKFDFSILGAGLAGLSIAQKLSKLGATVCIIDKNEIASGASGAPLGMVNPATGRFGNKVWNAERCLQATRLDLDQVQSTTDEIIFKNTGILRPAQDGKMAERMKENTIQQGWPKGWCTWLDEKQIAEINPDLHCMQGGMWLPEGLTVNLPKFLYAKAELLRKTGVEVFENADYASEISKSGIRITLKNSSNSIESDKIIFATGYGTTKLAMWDFLPLHLIKGQLAIFESPHSSDFDYSISALGYIASISRNRFVAGSTYEHHFDHLNPDQEGADYLVNRLGKVYPSLFEEATLVEQWAGVRMSMPNRKPVVGKHPDHENVFVYAGLGSKGLIYSEYVATLLAEHITKKNELPDDISITRFL